MIGSSNPAEEIEKLSEVLSVGRKVTIVGMGDMGFAYADKITVEAVKHCSYAQYEHALKVSFKAPRQRITREVYFYAGERHAKIPAVLEGHIDVKNPMQFSEPKSVGDGVTISQAKYRSCDSRNVTDILDRFQDSIVFRPERF